MKKIILVQKYKDNVVIADDIVYTISKFAKNIPEIKEGFEYEVEVDERNFLYEAKLLNDKEKIKGLLIIDFGTSGNDFDIDYPLSIGIIKTDNGLQIENVYYSKIFIQPNNFENEVFEISNLRIESGKEPEVVVSEINKFVGNWKEYRIAGWNVYFDYMFLKKLYKMTNIELNTYYNLIDIQSLFSFYYWKIMGRFEIKSMRDAYKILFKAQLPLIHNAIEDCIFELEILRKLLKELKS